MSLKVIWNRALIIIDALIYHFFMSHIEDKEKEVLIVFQQIFGDAILLQKTLVEYLKLYPAEEGYTVKILLRPNIHSFMLATMPLPSNLIFEEVDFNRFLLDFKYYKETVQKYRNTAGLLIVPGASMSADVFSTSNNAKRKIGAVKGKPVTKPFIMALFNRLAYTEKVIPEQGDMMIQSHRRLLNYLGDTDYKGQLSDLLIKERIIQGGYCVMCPSASVALKCWPTERFAQIIDYLYKKYGLVTHLCGGNGEEHFAEEIQFLVRNKTSVISHIGNTSFSDWSAIIQHADLVIGNDSATLHIAAAARKKSICIAGVYDKYLFFPYKVDFLAPGDNLPVTLIKDMPCEYCRTEGYFAGARNEECKQAINEGKCALCIDAISVKEVEEKIDELMVE